MEGNDMKELNTEKIDMVNGGSGMPRELNSVYCPVCHSTNVVIIGMQIVLGNTKVRYRCKDCNAEYMTN